MPTAAVPGRQPPRRLTLQPPAYLKSRSSAGQVAAEWKDRQCLSVVAGCLPLKPKHVQGAPSIVKVQPLPPRPLRGVMIENITGAWRIVIMLFGSGIPNTVSAGITLSAIASFGAHRSRDVTTVALAEIGISLAIGCGHNRVSRSTARCPDCETVRSGSVNGDHAFGRMRSSPARRTVRWRGPPPVRNWRY